MARERLLDWIARSKMTQREAAQMFRIHEVFLSQILKGVRTPGLETAARIEDLTGIPARSWAHGEVSESTAAPAVEPSKPAA